MRGVCGERLPTNLTPGISPWRGGSGRLRRRRVDAGPADRAVSSAAECGIVLFRPGYRRRRRDGRQRLSRRRSNSVFRLPSHAKLVRQRCSRGRRGHRRGSGFTLPSEKVVDRQGSMLGASRWSAPSRPCSIAPGLKTDGSVRDRADTEVSKFAQCR